MELVKHPQVASRVSAEKHSFPDWWWARAIPTSLKKSVLRPQYTITEMVGKVGREQEKGRERRKGRKKVGCLLLIDYKVHWTGIFLSLSSISFFM